MISCVPTFLDPIISGELVTQVNERPDPQDLPEYLQETNFLFSWLIAVDQCLEKEWKQQSRRSYSS
jgi:hypothetical protein